MTMTATVVATVMQISIDPQQRDPRRRYLARLRVDEVVEGDIPQDRLTLLVDTPRQAFADPNPEGSSFLVTMTPPLTDPYTGQLEIRADEWSKTAEDEWATE